ncbi:rRNA maturation RNAse YbeY, partial [bacterium]|nr:rRNA maturation RNAse YbeY [candidate division CSSED10-310 bacterium]
METMVSDQRDDPEPPLSIQILHDSLNIIAKHITSSPGTVEISLVNDQYIQELSRKYRNSDKPTNVLSFPYYEWKSPGDRSDSFQIPADPDYPLILGEII